MLELEKHLRSAGIPRSDWERLSRQIRCMAHIYNLAVVAVLKAMSPDAYKSEAAAAAANVTEEDLLVYPTVKLRKATVSVSFSMINSNSLLTMCRFVPPVNVAKLSSDLKL